jgi:hypothetical protein
MGTTVEALEAEVLSLSHSGRVRLLERLAMSLEPDPEMEAAWEKEADRREPQIADGTVRLVPEDEALARLMAKLL